MRGENSHPAVKRANELVAESIDKASLVRDAAHFLIATHHGELAALVTRHFDRTCSRRQDPAWVM
jgi:hypothetical protein